MKKIKLSILVVLTLPLMSCIGLPSALMGGYNIYSTASTIQSIQSLSTDRRTIGEIIDNKLSKIKVSNIIERVVGSGNDVEYVIFNKRVLLTGSIVDVNIKRKLLSEIDDVRGVHQIEDNLIIGYPTGIPSKGIDLAITALVKAEVLNMGLLNSVEIHTNKKIVYIMGILNKANLKVALEKIIDIAGVKSIRYYIVNEYDPSEIITQDDYIRYWATDLG